MLRVLRGNRGWANPERWVDYAMAHGFAPVAYDAREVCPDCGGAAGGSLGHFVYYSSRLELRSCGECALIYADALIDPALVGAHFETAYKDETYFRERREPVFRQIAKIVANLAPRGGTLLDVGGATGYLLTHIRERRPELVLSLNDRSEKALNTARATGAFKTVPGTIADLRARDRRYDVVIMSDVVYYEPAIRELWGIAGSIVAPGGHLVLRVPNKYALIRAGRILASRTHIHPVLQSRAPICLSEALPDKSTPARGIQ
jgi:SAM-dependent methyltransferase